MTSGIDAADVALIFEGGGMRASYSAGAVVTLIENGIDFPMVYGISAGSSHSVNYLSRDRERAKQSFVDLVQVPGACGWGTFAQGKGYFNADYLYEGIVEEQRGSGGVFDFDWEAFCKHPGDVHIEAFDVKTGETLAWTKADMPGWRDMMVRVRASSSMPFFMPHTMLDGRELADGGLGSSWGIPLDAAKRDGYKRFFIVRTRPKEYRKQPMGAAAKALFKLGLHGDPKVYARTVERWSHYNDICDEIERLEAAGSACVFYARDIEVSSRETDLAKLRRSYEMGYAQAQSELPRWLEFLAKS